MHFGEVRDQLERFRINLFPFDFRPDVQRRRIRLSVSTGLRACAAPPLLEGWLLPVR